MPGRIVNFAMYQERTEDTAVYPEAGSGSTAALQYAALGLNGESGEVANKVKKIARDDGGKLTIEKMMALQKELGDVLWYVAAMCREIGVTMEEVATFNILNLAGRQERGTLKGDGDNR